MAKRILGGRSDAIRIDRALFIAENARTVFLSCRRVCRDLCLFASKTRIYSGVDPVLFLLGS